jgi:hypothetical protein
MKDWMRLSAVAVGAALALTVTACAANDDPPSANGPTATSIAPSSAPTSTPSAAQATAAKPDAGEQFLKILGQASVTTPSRSHAVELGQVMAKAVCPQIKDSDQLIVASLTSPLLNAGYGNQDVDWVTTNAQQVGLALTLSFCDPHYS